MKKLLFLAAVAALLMSCNKETKEFNDLVKVGVALNGFTVATDEMTRGDIGDYVTMLDVWVIGDDNVSEVHQSSSGNGFGTFNLILNKTKSYTLYAIAHKAAEQATLADGVISFPDDKVTHSFFVSQTFTPTDGMSMTLTMNRIVALFRLETTDAVPDEAKKMRFTINNVFDRWNVTTGGTHQLDRTSTVNISSTASDGTAAFNIYAIVTDEITSHTVLVEALDANDGIIKSQTLENIPLLNNYRTVARGVFFTDAISSFSLAAGDWQEGQTITF